MSDRIGSFVVVLETDLRDDDAEPIAEAIRHLRGVLEVRPEIVGPHHIVARAQARGEIFAKLQRVIAEYV